MAARDAREDGGEDTAPRPAPGGGAPVRGERGGKIPPLGSAAEKALQAAVRELVRSGAAKSAHDCSEGGMAVALAEGCVIDGVGAGVKLAPVALPHALLFGEAPPRVVLSFAPERQQEVEEAC